MLFRTSLGDFLKSLIRRRNIKNGKDNFLETNVPKWPRTVFLETTNHCNLRCVMCTFHGHKKTPQEISLKRPMGFISRQLAFKVIDELGGSGEPIWLALHGAGEPLLHPEIDIFVERAGKYSNLNVGFLTNGMLLSSKLSEALLDAGIRWLSVSIDGINPVLMEKYRVGSDYQKICANFLAFIEKVRRRSLQVDLHVNMTIQEEMKPDVDKFVDHWLQYVDQVSVSPCRPVGSRKSYLVPRGVRRTPCYMLFEMMVVFWDGSVALCCEDWFNQVELGNVQSSSVYDIWHGERFNNVRAIHEAGNYSAISLCKECDMWFNKTPEIYFDDDRGCEVVVNAWQKVYKKLNTNERDLKNYAVQ